MEDDILPQWTPAESAYMRELLMDWIAELAWENGYLGWHESLERYRKWMLEETS